MYSFFKLLMILFLGSSCSSKAENPKITDTLFTSHFEQFRGVGGERRSELRELIPVIYSSKNEQIVLELIRFMVTNRYYGQEILPFFIQQKDTTFLNWFKKNGLQLIVSIDYWKVLNWNQHTFIKRDNHFEYNNRMPVMLIGFFRNYK
ncbi:MAG: hypothetical protein JW915_08485 [Chitinispirillaceae bacterium]|nr:hypothetical protein [Chitinispirillaceae bacterium]